MKSEKEIRERLKILNDIYWDDMSKKQLVLKQLYWVLEEDWSSPADSS
jgi:hypothetical protein